MTESDHPRTVQDLASAIESFAPLSLAADWDNVGVIIGSARRALDGPVLMTIDLTERVLAEAVKARASCIIAYHPPIFHATKRLTDEEPRQRIVLRAIQAGLTVYSPHSALDAAPGGMTDWLCEGVSGSDEQGRIMGDVRALEPYGEAPETQQVKVITFVPQSEADQVRAALASAGAGIIGKYTVCSFNTTGMGTFLAGDGANPTVGEVGNLETVPEVKIEMVCSRAALPVALEILRQFHPYEEPPIDIVELLPRPTRSTGHGRRITLDQPATLAEVAVRLKRFLGVSMVKVACANPDDREGTKTRVNRIGVCPGAGADLVGDALREKCELFVTGEMRYHEVIDCLNKGMSVMLAGHTNTERGYLVRLADRLAAMLPDVPFRVAKSDITPVVPH
ncbi:MAG: Nif3-like dinuclear metal center hexameric protein [Phycisphaeraceae bacterium]|nr:Nif3-like dinuclear metal center hexameric protein [Phycisphaerales bacterium]MCB9859949.1 Nif3-like dinuclear metal center hexameric protein [Phycisphaeraceae bacterium]